MTDENTNPIGKLPKWAQIALFFIIFIPGFLLIEQAKNYFNQFKEPTSVESAKTKIIGIWTYTQPIDPSGDTFPYQWVKWDVRPNGKMIAYYAFPKDDNWGKGKEIDYEIVTDKYSDTGTRWYGIRPVGTAIYGIYESGRLRLSKSFASTSGLMNKQDANPFSN